jgi:hypothetical protein
MTRSRLAALVLSAGLGLVAGCSSDFSFRNIFNHNRGTTECMDGGCCPDCVGGVSGFEGPVLTPPDVPTVPVVPETVAPPPVPPLAVPPRFVPTPAAPVPYSP